MRSLLFPTRATEASPVSPGMRATEATIDQLIATGAAGTYGIDPIDGDAGFVRVGQTGRQIPIWTREKLRAYSVAAYRLNPMARAVIDTYVAFCVGDSGVKVQCSDPGVDQVVRRVLPRPEGAHPRDAGGLPPRAPDLRRDDPRDARRAHHGCSPTQPGRPDQGHRRRARGRQHAVAGTAARLEARCSGPDLQYRPGRRSHRPSWCTPGPEGVRGDRGRGPVLAVVQDPHLGPAR